MAVFSKASIARHPIHPMLIPFPIGLWVFSLICDIVRRSGGSASWADAAFYAIGIGVIGGALAAIPGLIDFLALPRERMKSVAFWHMVINLTVETLFVIGFFLRRANPESGIAFALSIAGIVLLLVSGWLGGELVYVEGVGVVEEAQIEATLPLQ